MTRQEAINNQAELSKHYKLSYWYGTHCKKCCDVYPIFRTTESMDSKCWYECEVCGTRTGKYSMPWLAEKAWNDGNFLETQLTMEDI